MHSSDTRPAYASRRYLLVIILLAIALYVLIPQFSDFRASWYLLRRPMASWTILAIGLTAVTYLAGALTYRLLAFKPLRYGQVVIVQLAAMFVNRLLPAGIGALGANYAYLRHKKHSAAQATTVVAVNNFLGIIGHSLVLIIALSVGSSQVHLIPRESHGIVIKIIIGLAAGLFAGLTLLLILGRHRFKRTARELLSQLFSYRYRLQRLAAALMSSVLLTLSNVLCLGCCALALGIHLPFVIVLLIFSFGLGTGTATPTPGGLGGFEAGLTAGFIAYHVPSPAALAAALLYRLISYWLPLVVGALALLIVQKQRLFIA